MPETPPAELSLHFAGNADTGRRVRVAFDGTDSDWQPFEIPATTAQDREQVRWYVETYGAQSLADLDDNQARAIEARLPLIGQALFRAVFTDPGAAEVYSDFRRAEDRPRVLTIDAEDGAVLSLPWELLHDHHPKVGRFLFRERPPISIRRRISGATGGRRAFRVQPKDQLHLLFVVSRPADAGFIDPRTDPTAVLDAIAAAAPGRVTCEFLRPATLNALVERLDDDTKPAIDILHFDGHGVFRTLTEQEAKQHPDLYGRAVQSELQRARALRAVDKAGTDIPVGIGFLVFEQPHDSPEPGQMHLVSAADLADNLNRAKVGLIVLSACQTATLDAEQTDPFASVAGRLTSTGIPAVLAMTHAVLVATTRLLFAELYKALAKGRGLGAALDAARVYLANNPGKYDVRRGDRWRRLELQDWFLPALYSVGAGAGTDAALLAPASAAGSAGAPPAPAAPRSNLRPTRESGFHGRARELWVIERWFAVDGTRRVSLSAFGGTGKTELAEETGRWLTRTGLFQAAVRCDYA